MKTLMTRRWLLVAPALVLGACAVGPDYVKPDVAAPVSFKELDGFRPAQPQDTAPRGKWWEVFDDQTLNGLIEQIDTANPTLAQAEATYRQERAMIQAARAAYYPQVTANAAITRQNSGAGGRSSAAPAGVSAGPSIYTSHLAQLDASWEPDLWGSVRRKVEAAEATAQGSYATLENTRLSLRSELAIDYFQMRGLDAKRKLLDDTVIAYQKALNLTKNQYAVGVAQLSDVVQAQTQLVSTQAQAVDVGVQRAQMEHAVAVLVGKPPANLTLAPNPLTTEQLVPPAPVGIPSALLERRPDVAAAERNMAAANANIGVAISAWYPDLTLGLSGGFSSLNFEHWLTLPNRIWSLGPSLAATIFDGGAIDASVIGARAVYDQNVDAYRQAVLQAFQDVEDSLAALRILQEEDKLQLEAVKLAQKALDLEINRYKAGTVAYTDVITSQTVLLTNEETEVNLLSERVMYSVELVKAIGGGWDASTMTPENLKLAADAPVRN